MTDYRGEEWAEKLLAMADAANVPSDNPDPNWRSDIDFDLADGWKMSIFYDVGDLDYINHFVAPDGEVVDFWDWPDLTDLTDTEDTWNWADPDKRMLMGWRGTRVFA